MGKIVKKTDFFKERLETPVEPEKQTPAAAPAPVSAEPVQKAPEEPRETLAVTAEPEVVIAPLELGASMAGSVRDTMQLLAELGQKELALSVKQAYHDATSERFSVAVVGEFSRGKSTFLNRFLGGEFLPVGTLPTTAVLTRIRYNGENVIQCYDQNGKRCLSQPLTEEVWDNLVADNFTDRDPQGTVLVGINDPWLKKSGIELLDTPGAGDLDAKRAQVIGDALLRADGAIITISALQALSMSEKLFIEQRLIARKVPYLMLILTKLDQVPLAQRNELIGYVLGKLKQWSMDIPVFLPYDVELPDGKYADLMGMDRIKDRLIEWRCDPDRARLTRRWLAGKLVGALATAAEALQEQRKLLSGKEEERIEKLRQKQELLEKAKLAWGELQIGMLARCTECQEELARKAEECTQTIVERLQYESNMAASPKRWWNENYPYRLKIELANLSAALDNLAKRTITADANWFNGAMEKQFKTHILVEKENIADKSVYGDYSARADVRFKDLEKRRTLVRVGTSVLTIAGAMLCASAGAYPAIATMGIGTGSSIISEGLFRKEVEKQKLAIRDAIEKNVPDLVEKAMSDSDKRLQAVYNDMIREAEKQEQLWLSAQQSAIAKASGADRGNLHKVEQQLAQIDAMTAKLLCLG